MGCEVLLVEDDERIRQALGLALADEGFAVVEAASGEEALQRLAGNDVDVVLLDLMLPGIGGLDVCRRLRAEGDLPIIIVSARTDSVDVIGGLEAGADDYVTKPLVARELAARIRALLRRRQPADQADRRKVLRLGEVEVHPEEEVVRRAGREVHLTRTEFRLLLELAVAGAGRVVTREELLQPEQDDPDLGPLATTFNATAGELQQRMQRDARFAGDVSHELRSPLTTIVNATQVLSRRRHELPPTAVRAVDLLESEVHRFQRMVVDLLEISRGDQTSDAQTLETLDLVELVRNVLATRPGEPPDLDADGSPAFVVGDRRRLDRVVANLLDNAGSYAGGAVRVAVFRHRDRVRLEVDDQGSGVPEALREQVFERFTRGARAGQRAGGSGDGLGLALVAQHVVRHRGAVWVEDRPGGRSAFRRRAAPGRGLREERVGGPPLCRRVPTVTALHLRNGRTTTCSPAASSRVRTSSRSPTEARCTPTRCSTPVRRWTRSSGATGAHGSSSCTRTSRPVVGNRGPCGRTCGPPACSTVWTGWPWSLTPNGSRTPRVWVASDAHSTSRGSAPTVVRRHSPGCGG